MLNNEYSSVLIPPSCIDGIEHTWVRDITLGCADISDNLHTVRLFRKNDTYVVPKNSIELTSKFTEYANTHQLRNIITAIIAHGPHWVTIIYDSRDGILAKVGDNYVYFHRTKRLTLPCAVLLMRKIFKF
jgi:hypothetical protein